MRSRSAGPDFFRVATALVRLFQVPTFFVFDPIESLHRVINFCYSWQLGIQATSLA